MNTILQNNLFLVIVAIIWVLPWKGYALWTASQKHNKRWFLVILVLNTFALLDIFYIFYIAKKTPKDILNLFNTKI